MLRIGYVRQWANGSGLGRGAAADLTAEASRLRALGCEVVRTETPATESFPVLRSILETIGEGDELTVARLEQLGDSGRALLETLQALDGRGASLRVLAPELSTRGPGGHALCAALEAVTALESLGAGRSRRAAAPEEIRSLQRAGVGPVEIARRLGVSRMTVWRKLKALEDCV